MLSTRKITKQQNHDHVYNYGYHQGDAHRETVDPIKSQKLNLEAGQWNHDDEKQYGGNDQNEKFR